MFSPNFDIRIAATILLTGVLLVIWFSAAISALYKKIEILISNLLSERKAQNMDKKQEELMRNLFKDGLERQHRRGLREGAVAICSVIKGMAQDSSVNAEQRLEKIIAFCDVSLNAKDTNDKKKPEEKGGESE